eukprot:CAMPEP_0119395868 /NCGR_PEP_ID=MMETSP1334-20130426/134754_1 /TAXON_ID=127549 /ORGANISM="Calcidiscus leptoporus, Strain RCC1130" /LENGTH=33 /DNA_ID= /DNA_START= /DNA_END= /DNA_ORIENTATION=
MTAYPSPSKGALGPPTQRNLGASGMVILTAVDL